jgi:hypothetical protein
MRPASSGNPFPGLRPYSYHEAALFFGRDQQSDELVRRLATTRFLAVVGTSGSGKSSLVRAGLLPSLEAGFMAPAGAHWRFCIFRPQHDPIGFLTRALVDSGVVPPIGLDEAAAGAVIETTLRRSSLGLIESARLARPQTHDNIAIVVDQFEELFRYADEARRAGKADDSAAFVRLLLEATRQIEIPLYVVLTMRSDFLGDCARFRDLPEAISNSQYLVPRLTRDELKAAITGPVGVSGAEVEPMLVQELLNSVGDDMDQLPLLQHALMRTWEKWLNDGQPRPIGVKDLAKAGGMADALSIHAEETYAALPSDRARTVAARTFKRLAERGPDNRELRRPTKLSRLEAIGGTSREDLVAVVDGFRAPARSFVLPPPEVDLADESVIDITHESLIRQWQRLRAWVAEESESRAMYERLLEAAQLYESGRGALWREPDLKYAREWRARQIPTAEWADQYGGNLAAVERFLERSEEAWAAEVKEKREAALAKQRELENARALADEQRRRADDRALAKQRELEQAQALADEQRKRADDQSAARARQRLFTIGLALSLAAAVIAAAFALNSRATAVRNAEEATRQAAVAAENARNATIQAKRADTNASKAEEQAKLAEDRRAALQKALAAISDPAARQILSEQLDPDAARQLSEEGIRTKLATEKVRAGGGSKATARAEAGGLKLWTNGSTLRVRFLDGDAALRERVLRVAREWRKYANVQFEETDARDAEIRVSFKDPGVWSFVGTDALGVATNAQTVNFGWLTKDTEEREFRRAVLHEFGHVLGLIHEYQNPNADIPWNRPAVLQLMTGAPNYWDRAAVESNLFRKESIPASSYRPYDPESIMMLGAFDQSYFTRPFTITQNNELSASDKAFIARLYPQ